MKYTIYTDGAYSKQHDEGAFAYVILNGENAEIERNAYKITKETNNRAELKAIIAAVNRLPDDATEVCIFSDSQYALNTLSGKWKHYYNGTVSPIDMCKKDKGYSLAWLHHRGRNKHHYEYWIDYLDDGGKPIEMPRKYAIELICDWIAAGKTYSKNQGKKFTYPDELKYVKWKLNLANMHPNTKSYVLGCFTHFAFHNKFDSYYVTNTII